MSDREKGPVRLRWAERRLSIIGPLLADPPEHGELRARHEELAWEPLHSRRFCPATRARVINMHFTRGKFASNQSTNRVWRLIQDPRITEVRHLTAVKPYSGVRKVWVNENCVVIGAGRPVLTVASMEKRDVRQMYPGRIQTSFLECIVDSNSILSWYDYSTYTS
jgi:hypothetical protein